jgi:hypothetical protein
MADVPTLVFSERPASLFDDAVWATAQQAAIASIGATDPATAAAVALMAGYAEAAATQRAAVTDAPTLAALDQLAAVVDGAPLDLGAARGLLADNASSPSVQNVIWLLGFQAKVQPLIDAVTAVTIPTRFATPYPPMELVIDGATTADYALRLPRWPMAETSRQAPKRPYLPGIVTIEPVYRPGR